MTINCRVAGETLEPARTYQHNGYTVVYATSVPTVRWAVYDSCDVLIVDVTSLDRPAKVVRWANTMSARPMLGVVGTPPDSVDDGVVDVVLEPPVTTVTADTVTARLADRDAYVDAVDALYHALGDGSSEREPTAIPSATTEQFEQLDDDDRVRLLDTICG